MKKYKENKISIKPITFWFVSFLKNLENFSIPLISLILFSYFFLYHNYIKNTNTIFIYSLFLPIHISYCMLIKYLRFKIKNTNNKVF